MGNGRKQKMEKDEKENVCKRALKFLGFHISNEEGILLCNELDEHVWGISPEETYLPPASEDVKKDLDDVADVLMRAERFWISRAIGGICFVDNPFYGCSLEEIAIKLDLME